MFKIKAFLRKALLCVLAGGCHILDTFRKYRQILLNAVILLCLTSLACVTVQRSGEYRIMRVTPALLHLEKAGVMGTGFRFRVGDQTFIGTASHVCVGMINRSGGYDVNLTSGPNPKTGKILSYSLNEDTCIISDTIGGPYLNLANGFNTGADVYTVGFPGGLRFYYGTGQVLVDLKKETVVFLGDEIDQLYCNMLGKPVGVLPNLMRYCNLTQPFITSNILADHGQSGSPLLNSDHEVIGVLAQQEVNGSYSAPAESLLKLVKGLKK